MSIYLNIEVITPEYTIYWQDPSMWIAKAIFAEEDEKRRAEFPDDEFDSTIELLSLQMISGDFDSDFNVYESMAKVAKLNARIINISIKSFNAHESMIKASKLMLTALEAIYNHNVTGIRVWIA